MFYILWLFSSVQFNHSLCLNLCDPRDCRTPGFPVHHQLLELIQTHVHHVSDAIQPSHPLVPFSSCLQSFPASGSFPMSEVFASGGQSIRVSALASVLPMNIQDWFLLGLTGFISCSPRDSQESSPIPVQKYKFFGAQPFLWAKSHIHTTTGKTIA